MVGSEPRMSKTSLVQVHRRSSPMPLVSKKKLTVLKGCSSEIVVLFLDERAKRAISFSLGIAKKGF